ncbi:unnamed protein product [Mytilus coruscus]|uniref:Death domain-containing protein n=1 Tax=Mytilus coruscus TaxID=42192 RepID=A0A6J8D1L6_MYTCO|nr:unnamed protein product [Mytilus coruscus]
MDIEALGILHKQKDALKALPNPTDISFKKYEDKVTKTMTIVRGDIQLVSKYSENILAELKNVREQIKLCSVKIGEQMKELMKHDFLKLERVEPGRKYRPVSPNARVTREYIETKKLEQVQAMQRLAKQNQELMEFIAETEDLVLKIESDAELSFSDISGVKGHLNEWCDGLETLKEKKRRIKEEKENEEREKRKQEEAERRRKEKEEKEAAEKKRKLEQEKKRRNWKTWPPFIYQNYLQNNFKQKLCCVLFIMPNGIQKNDIICEGSDEVNDLARCLQSNDEKVISSIITITPRDDKEIKFQMPIRVYVPIVSHDKTLVPVLKYNINEKKWRTGQRLPEVQLDDVYGISFVGVEIPLTQLKQLQCVAVARHPRDETEVDEGGKEFEPEGDRNIKLKFPPAAFPGITTVATVTVPWTQNDIINASKRHRELQNIKIAGSYINISCENSTNADSDLEIYNLGWEDDASIDTFVENLSSSQPNVADKIMAVKSKVQNSRKSKDSKYDFNFASDFDPDFEKKEGIVYIVSKVSGKSWEIASIEETDAHPKARFLKLPAGNNNFQVLGLVVPFEMKDEDICKAAEILESLNFVTKVSLICRQKHADPHDAVIQCVRTENIADTLHHLDALGYTDGPPESSEFGVVDGEEIEVQHESNLYFEYYQYSTLKMKFYSNLSVERYSGNLLVLNKGDQAEDDKYHGHFSYSVLPGRLSIPRQGTFVLYVPKPLEENVTNFPYTLGVPVKALAKFIAWQMTCTNSNSTKWVCLGKNLTDGDAQLYHQILENVKDQRDNAEERERCELYILYWSNHHAPDVTDKIAKIIAAHRHTQLEAEAKQFIKPFIPGRGILSNDNLEKMAYVLAKDWEVFAKKLGFSSDEINKNQIEPTW